MKNFITKLQEKPYETRLKIMWGSVLVIGVLLIAVLIFSIKNTVNGVTGKSLTTFSPNQTNNTPQATVKYATVEQVEQTSNDLKIYFNFNNTTNDILDLPQLSDISLSINGNKINPTKITDRQGNTFVQKILSHTQNFGILIFPATDGKQGSLIFDKMFFEKDITAVFQQKLDLNFEQLNKPPQVRN